jgi:hypothetical protein
MSSSIGGRSLQVAMQRANTTQFWVPAPPVSGNRLGKRVRESMGGSRRGVSGELARECWNVASRRVERVGRDMRGETCVGSAGG